MGGRGGHYVSLIPKVPMSPLPNPDTLNVLTSESKILKALFVDPTIVALSIERLKNVNLDFPSIMNSDIMETLNTVKNHYSSDTVTGISVRQFITKCNNELLTANRSNNCLDVTVVNLDSCIVDSTTSCTLELSVIEHPDDHHQSVHTSCPSIIYPSILTTPSIITTPSLRKSVKLRVSTTSPEQISDLNRRKMKTVSSTELTPPPPSKKKRVSPQKRKRGRPRKNIF